MLNAKKTGKECNKANSNHNNKMENIVVFRDLKILNLYNSLNLFSCIRTEKITFVDKNPHLKIISFQKYKHYYLIHT